MFPKESPLFFTAGCITLLGTISSPAHASISDVPSSSRQDVRCMMGVLHKMPRVDHVESGVWLDNGWRHPFVQYHYQELDGRDGTVRFVALTLKASKDTAQYLAYLNGLSTPGGPPPPTLGTGEIARQWELECGIFAAAIFV
jgi:hypothetical protein